MCEMITMSTGVRVCTQVMNMHYSQNVQTSPQPVLHVFVNNEEECQLVHNMAEEGGLKEEHY